MIIKLMGSLLQEINKSITSALSWISPSVMMNNIMYSDFIGLFWKFWQIEIASLSSYENFVGPENFKYGNIVRYAFIMFYF